MILVLSQNVRLETCDGTIIQLNSVNPYTYDLVLSNGKAGKAVKFDVDFGCSAKLDPCDANNNPCQNDGICSGELGGAYM